MNLEFVMLVLQAMRKRWILMVLIPLLCVIGAGYLSYFVLTPMYAATTTMLVKPQDLDRQDLYNSILSNQQLIKTYSSLIQTRRMAQDVIRKLELSHTPEELLEQLKVETSSISFIITVTYTDRDPLLAIQIANEVSRSFSQNINLFMNVDNVMIVDEAEYKPGIEPVFPKPLIIMALAFTVGLMLMIGVLIWIEALAAMRKKPRRKRMSLEQTDSKQEAMAEPIPKELELKLEAKAGPMLEPMLEPIPEPIPERISVPEWEALERNDTSEVRV